MNAPAKKAAPEITTVVMADGRAVDFSGKRRLQKEAFQHEDGSVSIRLDFRNGQTRTFPIPQSLILKFAAHGAEQKLGDEVAGLEDVEDMVVAIDTLTDRLTSGEWAAPRAAGTGAGGSILTKALAEFRPNLSPEQIRAFLSGKSHAEKLALRKSGSLAPIIARLEAEKAAKKPEAAADGEALLEGL